MTYDLNFWIGIIGFIATLVFGVLSIYLVRVRRYPGHLTFIQEQVIGLFDSIVKNFPQINITYDTKNIDQQIVLLKGALINSGSIDIKETMVEERLCLKLPDNFKWLSAKVIDATTGSKANLEIVNNRIFINLGLFRKNEFIRFEALADIPSDNKDNSPATIIFKDKLSFEHRIADTDKVEKRESELELPSFKNNLGIFKIVYFLMVLFATIYFIFLSPDKRRDYAEFNYQLKYDSTVKIVKATPHLNGTVDLLTLQGKDISTINIVEFNSRLQKIETNDFKTDGWFSTFLSKNIQTVTTIMMLVMLFITSTFVVSPIVEYRKVKKLRHSLNLDKVTK